MKKYLILLFLLIPSLCFAGSIEENTVAYGGILFSNDFAGYVGTISAPTADTYYGFINGSATSNMVGMTFVEDDTNGDYLLIAIAGNYKFTDGASSFSLASPSGETIHCAAFVNDTEEKVEFQRVLAAGADVGSACMPGDYITLAVGDKVRIKCKTSGTNETLNIQHMGLLLERVFTTHTRIIQTGTPCYGPFGCF